MNAFKTATLAEFVRASKPAAMTIEAHIEKNLRVSKRYYRRLLAGTRGNGVPIYIWQLDKLARDRGEVVALRLPNSPPFLLGLPLPSANPSLN